MDSGEKISRRFRIGQIINAETGKVISFDQLIDQLEPNDLIFIGEVHGNPEHHLIQIQILQSLMTRYGTLNVAMECFQQHQQPALDRYMKGFITEEVFLEAVDWRKEWAFHYHFYRPLLLIVSEKEGDVLAINAPNKIVRKVARSGLSSLEPEERDQWASQIDLNNEEHRAYLREVYELHDQQDLKEFEYFYQAQCVWEDTMAENIANYMRQHNERMVVFAGNGHIINRFGIPDRTSRRIPVKMATIVLQPLKARLTINKETSYFLWFTCTCSQMHPKIGDQP